MRSWINNRRTPRIRCEWYSTLPAPRLARSLTNRSSRSAGRAHRAVEWSMRGPERQRLAPE